MRYELSDKEWSVIRAMLPTKPRGVPRIDDRRVLNGIFWVLRSGAPWRDLPGIYRPRTTCQWCASTSMPRASPTAATKQSDARAEDHEQATYGRRRKGACLYGSASRLAKLMTTDSVQRC